MEAAGLAGVHKWGVILPTSTREVKSIYEPAIATIYPSLCKVHNRQWKIGTPRQAIPTNLPTGPLIHTTTSKPIRKTSCRRGRNQAGVPAHHSGDEQISNWHHSPNRLAGNDQQNWSQSCPRHSPTNGYTQHIQIENVVTVAGATARHGLILHFNIGFLSGNSQNMTEDDITESYLRANVGYTRATNSLLMASPLDSQTFKFFFLVSESPSLAKYELRISYFQPSTPKSKKWKEHACCERICSLRINDTNRSKGRNQVPKTGPQNTRVSGFVWR